ncbi:MAG: hypothetical protein AAF433_16450 [Bacteroidota bacterium]
MITHISRLLGLLFISLGGGLFGPLLAQNLSSDLSRLADNVVVAAANPSSTANPALDEIIQILAYYAKAPDLSAAAEIATGPLILEHYSANAAMQQFFTEQGIDTLLATYLPATEISFSNLVSRGRESFLRRPASTELFTTNGLIDVNKIQSAYTAPLPPLENALGLAADQAAANNGSIDQRSSYMSTALAGLSDWIGRRAQEELTYTFLNRLRDQLNDNNLNYLFPETVNYLPTLNLINYKSILPSIRLAFAKDLNAISLNLGNFIQAENKGTYNNPAVYNLFLVYRLLDLAGREVPLAEILAFTYGELNESRRNLRRNIDLELAEKARSSPEFAPLRDAYIRIADRLEELEEAFQQARSALEDDYSFITDRDDGFEVLEPLDSVLQPVLDFNYANLLFPNDKAPEVIESWLFGREAIDYFLDNPSVSRYDQFYGPNRDTLSESELIAAGLTGVREVLNRRHELQTRYSELINARRAMDALKGRLAREANANPTLLAIKDSLLSRLEQEQVFFRALTTDEEQRTADSIQLQFLQNLLEETLVQHPNKDQTYAQLTAISERLDAFTEGKGQLSPNYRRLHPAVEPPASFPALESLLGSMDIDFDQLQYSLTSYSQREAGATIRAHRNAANFETVFGLGREMFFFLYDSPFAAGDSTLGKAEQPSLLLADNFSSNETQITDFAGTGVLTTYLLDPQANPLVRGLALERLQQVPGMGAISAPELGSLILDFTEALHEYKNIAQVGDDRTARRIALVNFITSTVSSVVEAKIMVNPLQPNQPLSLADQLPGFNKVPAINDNLQELFAYSQQGEFRYAITNLVNLIDLFNIVPRPSRAQERRIAERDAIQLRLDDAVPTGVEPQLSSLGLSTRTQITPQNQLEMEEELARLNRQISRADTARMNRNRQQLFLYGTFMADVAAADSPDAFAAALNTVALPAGSSQLKRNKPFSLEVNAYFGVTYGQERLNLPDDPDGSRNLPDATSNVVSLFVPVGLSMSWKNSYTQKSSYSLFFPIIDLGAVSAYRFDQGANNQIRELPEFEFQNVFAPGAHLMYNFAKSPFSLGAGVQYGPSLRRIRLEGEPIIKVSAVRFMLSLSIDVPIFSFTNRP